MQNQFVGDVGDFGKYGLLRHLCGLRDGVEGPVLSLGVNWYLMPDEGGHAGRHLAYLHPPPKSRHRDRFRVCDHQLYEDLYNIVYDGSYPEVKVERRTVRAVQESGILRNSVFFDDPLVVDDRQVDRNTWVNDAVSRLDGCEVVFVDPDNGLEPVTRPGPKHVLYTDLEPYIRTGRTLVVYHHLGRKGSAEDQVRALRQALRCRLQIAGEITSLWYRRGTARAYFIVPNGREDLLQQRIRSLIEGDWGQQRVRGRPHFQLVV